MDLLYQGGPDLVLFIIDRKNEKLEIANKQSNYNLMDCRFDELFKANKISGESITIEEARLLSDEEFIKKITKAMVAAGYIRKELPNDTDE